MMEVNPLDFKMDYSLTALVEQVETIKVYDVCPVPFDSKEGSSVEAGA